jgi:methionyl-tRNA formyltransferase
MRVLFAGTPSIALPSLNALLDSSHAVVGVLTAPDRASGRGRKLSPSVVKQRALEAGIAVLTPERLDSDARKAVRALEPELLACIAYGKIFGPKFLSLFPKGAINVHPSLLPKYRGPAPISAAIWNGDDRTGVTVQEMAREMDAGDILMQEEADLTGEETTGSLTERLAPLGARLLVATIDRLAEGAVTPVPQSHTEATYTRLIEKDDGRIDWSRSALDIERQVRAVLPWPKAHTTFRGDRLTILETAVVAGDRAATPGTIVSVDRTEGILVETGNGLLALRTLQLPSRKPLDWKSFANGVRELEGTMLGGS